MASANSHSHEDVRTRHPLQMLDHLPPAPPLRTRILSRHKACKVYRGPDSFPEDVSSKGDNGCKIECLDEIGSGVFGQVYKATFKGKECAVTVCQNLKVETKEKFSEFIEGSRLLTNVVHPNVVQLLDVFWSNERCVPMMVMELMNESLATYVQRSSIEIGIKLSILHDVAAGLHYLHTRNPPIVHRDLSSNNVLLEFAGNDGTLPVAKISEFGLAKLKDECISKQGNINFLAPEALKENQMFDTPADIYSYACIALFLINQEQPTLADMEADSEMSSIPNISEVERRHKYIDKMTEVVPALTELSQLIMACLNDDPAHRPSAQILLEKVQLEIKVLNNSWRRNIDTLLYETETPVPHQEEQEQLGHSSLTRKLRFLIHDIELATLTPTAEPKASNIQELQTIKDEMERLRKSIAEEKKLIAELKWELQSCIQWHKEACERLRNNLRQKEKQNLITKRGKLAIYELQDINRECKVCSTDNQVDFSEILQLHLTDISASLNIEALYPWMIQYELLTLEEYHEIQCKPLHSEKIDRLVAILYSKGTCAYSKFIKCLESENEHLGHSELVLKLKRTCAKLQLQEGDSTLRAQIMKFPYQLSYGPPKWKNLPFQLLDTPCYEEITKEFSDHKRVFLWFMLEFQLCGRISAESWLAIMEAFQ